MKNIIIFLLRIALGIGFLSAVADRFGIWGHPGDTAVAWGSWTNFVLYTGRLNFNASGAVANLFGIIATGLEITFGILLIIGFKIKYISFFSGILLLIFAMEMSFNTTLKSAFDASVFTASFGAFLLSFQTEFIWSIDDLLRKK